MKANILNSAGALSKKRGAAYGPIHYRKTGLRTLSFYRAHDKKKIATYTHHPFLDKEGYIYGSFKIAVNCDEETLRELVKTCKKYWSKNKRTSLSDILPGFECSEQPLKGFRFELWKGQNDTFAKVLIHSGIEVDFISATQIKFKINKGKDSFFIFSIASNNKGQINYEALRSAHISFLERKICMNPKKGAIEKLDAYLGNKDPERVAYYKLIHGLS